MNHLKESNGDNSKKNGTQVFELPFDHDYAPGLKLRFAIYGSGYVRNVNGCFSCYQLNKVKTIKRKVNDEYSYDRKERILIYSRENRLKFLFEFILKNYYLKRRKVVEYRESYIPPRQEPSVSVTIDGHRYNIQ